MKYIDIEVTKEDVDQGKRGNALFCPVALASKRKFPYAEVSAGMTSIFIQNEFYSYSNILMKQVDFFDHGGKFTPRTYRVFKEEE